ncbi:hypothetical protein [Peribacillus frigoritolerans]|uniref:hypothetical protein n=1 Tax=Peribacillus frigoritolerans TaxID=450367 RepID=UPI002B05884D|nr:hypothetical protein [Peribacillus frigoritolerans]MEA3573930.1 hypothetical protein [Peribacillus frigoritolerans]
MKFTLTYNNVMLFLVAMVPFTNQLFNTISKLSYIQYTPYICIIIIFLFSKERFNINNKLKGVFILFVGIYTISPILGLTLFKYNSVKNLSYIMLFLIFILSLSIIVSFINMNNYKTVLQIILIGNSILLIYNLLLNLNEINMENFKWLISGERESRANLGFLHPNTAGMFLFIEIILLYYIYKLKIGFAYIWIPSIFILLIFLLATGSRTALLSTILFFILNLYSKVMSKINVKLQLSVFFGVILPVLTLSLLNFNFNDFVDSASGRGTALAQNLNVLNQHNSFFFGIAPVNVSDLKILIIGLTFSDNWYITHLIQFGFIGMVLFITNILIVIINAVKQNNHIILTLLMVLLFYSAAENVMFIPGVLVSWVVWILILFNMKINMEY